MKGIDERNNSSVDVDGDFAFGCAGGVVWRAAKNPFEVAALGDPDNEVTQTQETLHGHIPTDLEFVADSNSNLGKSQKLPTAINRPAENRISKGRSAQTVYSDKDEDSEGRETTAAVPPSRPRGRAAQPEERGEAPDESKVPFSDEDEEDTTQQAPPSPGQPLHTLAIMGTL
jgi:hypothetical protein